MPETDPVPETNPVPATDRVPAVVIRAIEGEQVTAAGVRHLFKLTGAQTGGRLALETFVLPAETVGARPHIHHAHDEYFYVLSGQLTVATDSGEVAVGPGDLAHAPRGSVHGFRNASNDEPATVLCLYSPAGYEQYFRDVHDAVAAGAEPDPELLRQLRAGYHTDTL